MKYVLAISASVLALGSSAFAQDFTQPATAGSVSLNSGFTPDPHTAQITSGGTISASNVGGNCRGWIANAPDYSVSYSAGNLFDLTIGVDSNSDTTLVINDPNGNWYCDDDGGEGLNPLISFSNPLSGRYDVWVGSYQSGEYASSTLSVSEIGEVAEHYDQPTVYGPDYSLPALYGSVSLNSGFAPDPYRVNVVSGGQFAASDVRSGCRGWVAGPPDFELSFSAGSLPLIISANSSSDTTLLINDPNGNWHCDDDGGNAGLNPALTFHNAMSGTYDIWIGSYRQGENANASLSISELYSE
ncbi:hypothetical protein [Maricaulis sp.]|uniref:hypothetical protein n=1 Tax=unclassified Maricaulis TaxID=2632371 RepID=UPI001B2E6708|nr:hypothetical protein [Maricaulis sp.]MBO6795537.1 peptidase [Maricaulis sp.]